MSKKEMCAYLTMRDKAENAVRTSKDVIDLGYGKKYDRLLNILVNFEIEGLYKTRTKGALATMAEAICKVLDYEARERGQEPSEQSTDSKDGERQ